MESDRATIFWLREKQILEKGLGSQPEIFQAKREVLCNYGTWINISLKT